MKAKTQKKRNARPAMTDLQGNATLRELDPAAADLVIREGELIHLRVRECIYDSEVPIAHAYFPLEAIISIVAQMRDGTMIEVGTVGREGVSAVPLLLGAATTANASYCQVPGRAIKITVDVFRELMTNAPAFRQTLDRYLQAYVNMLGQLAACNRLHSIDERCARWLLMSFDRVGEPRIELTHEYLAMMLGTTRSGVSIAAATFKHAGLIDYGHGIISILDRDGLEDASCECYAVAREQFGGLLRTVHGTAEGG